jgi:Spy/CpxP family protein refolding chaperone
MPTMPTRLAWIVFCLVTLPAAAHADTRRAAMRREVFDKLDLSADQKRGLVALHERRQEKEAALAHQLEDAKHALAEALVGEGPDASLTALHERLGQAREAVAAYRFDGLLEVRKLLRPDQRRRFGELYLEFRHKEAESPYGGE